MDYVLCQRLGIECNEKEYMIPEGNKVNWVTLLTNIILSLPTSKFRGYEVDIDEIIEAVYHYNTDYVINNVESFIKSFYFMKVIGIKVLAYFENITMFDSETREYYKHLYENEKWIEKDELLDYVKELDATRELDISMHAIVRDI